MSLRLYLTLIQYRKYEFTMISSRLAADVLATFNHLMQEVFKEHLDNFGLVFFDDILVYSKNATDHEVHVWKAL